MKVRRRSERPAHHTSRVGFSALMIRVHLTFLQLQGSTKAPLRGDKERPVRLRTTGGLAAARSGDPQSMRMTRAPEALRPLRRIPKTGRGRDGPWLTRTRTRARVRRLRVLACNTHNAVAVPRHEARIRSVHRRAMRTSSVAVLASRPRAASNGHRSGGYLMYRRSDSGGVRAR